MSEILDKLVDKPPTKKWRKYCYGLTMQVHVFEEAAEVAKKGSMTMGALVEELLREFNKKVAKAAEKRKKLCEEKKKEEDAKRAAKWLRQTTSTARLATAKWTQQTQSRGRAARGRRRGAGKGLPKMV